MFEEDFTEEGIIESVQNGFAEISLPQKGHCEECSAKIICRTNDSGKKTVLLENNFKGKVGDKIRISVTEKNILHATFLLYGFPVFLIVAGVIAGMQFFNNELISAIFGFSLAAIFFLVLFFFYKRREQIITCGQKSFHSYSSD